MVKVEYNLSELNAALRDYVRLSGKTVEEALKKQGAKLGFMLRQELRRIAPAKGSIRAEAERRLASGQGVKVRESVLRKVFQKRGARSQLGSGRLVFGKKGTGTTRAGLNLMALAVKQEISLRESARGFLGVSATYPGISKQLDNAKAVSRFGPVLSRAGFKASATGGAVEFQWGGLGELTTSAAAGLTKTKGEAAINRALAGTLEDIEVYLTRKLQEDWNRS